MKNIFKRAIALVLVVGLLTALGVTLIACGSKKDPNKLYVGLECAYSPFNYTQFDNQNDAVEIVDTNYKHKASYGYANGYDVMIARRIAAALGKELVVVKCDFDGLINAVNAGTIDLIIAGMSPTADRAETIDFSDAYYESNLVIVVRRDSQYANATSLADFSGAKIVAQQTTFHDKALSEQGGNYNIQRQTPQKDFPAMINSLKTRAVDGYIAEEPGAIENCASNQEFTYVRLVNNSTGFTATQEDTAIAVGLKKGSALTAQINTILEGISQAERTQMMNTAINLSSGTNVVE